MPERLQSGALFSSYSTAVFPPIQLPFFLLFTCQSLLFKSNVSEVFVESESTAVISPDATECRSACKVVRCFSPIQLLFFLLFNCHVFLLFICQYLLFKSNVSEVLVESESTRVSTLDATACRSAWIKPPN